MKTRPPRPPRSRSRRKAPQDEQLKKAMKCEGTAGEGVDFTLRRARLMPGPFALRVFLGISQLADFRVRRPWQLHRQPSQAVLTSGGMRSLLLFVFTPIFRIANLQLCLLMRNREQRTIALREIPTPKPIKSPFHCASFRVAFPAIDEAALVVHGNNAGVVPLFRISPGDQPWGSG